MSAPSFASMTSFVTGATCLAPSWNNNYGYIVSALTSGSRDITIRSLVASTITASAATPSNIAGSVIFSGNPSVAGTLTVNGNVTMTACTITGELRGDRCNLFYGVADQSINAINDLYLKLDCADTTSQNVSAAYSMHRSGYVVGYSYSSTPGAVVTSLPARQFQIRKNGTAIYSAVTQQLSIPNLNLTVASALTQGPYSFATGDLVGTVYKKINTGTADIQVFAMLEVVFAT